MIIFRDGGDHPLFLSKKKHTHARTHIHTHNRNLIPFPSPSTSMLGLGFLVRDFLALERRLRGRVA